MPTLPIPKFVESLKYVQRLVRQIPTDAMPAELQQSLGEADYRIYEMLRELEAADAKSFASDDLPLECEAAISAS